jgi:DNA-binding beta-propeller fold protein YncE
VRRALLIRLLLFWFTLPILSAQSWHPIAAAEASNGILFLLTSEKSVLAVNLTKSSGSIVGRFSFQILGNPVDMALGTFNSQPALFIASNYAVGSTFEGQVTAFTTDGQSLTFWTFRLPINGITFDATGSTIYFTSGNEVYALSPVLKSQASFVGTISGAQNFGPLTIAAGIHTLYIADAQGDIFHMDLTAKSHPSGVLGHTQLPQALLVSSPASTVYVADGGASQVVTFPTVSTKPASPHSFTPRGSFPNPCGLAWLDPAHLIVADQRNGSVTVLDAAGHSVYSMVLH